MMSDFISTKLNAIEFDDIFATVVLSLRKCIRSFDLALHPAKISDFDNITENVQHIVALRDFKHSDFFLKATAQAVDSNPNLASVVALAGKAALGVAEIGDAGCETGSSSSEVR